MTKKIISSTDLFPEPYIKFKASKNPDTGAEVLNISELSDKTPMESSEMPKKLLKALRNATGTFDFKVAFEIIQKIAKGLPYMSSETRLNTAAMLLQTMNPQDETEAMLLGQFLVLQDTGLNLLSQAHSSEMFYHLKELNQLSVKALRCANETMQTFLKYRSGGKQQIQIIHMSGDSKAVIANEMNTGGS